MSETPSEIVIYTGGFHFGGGGTRVRTVLGSCIAVTMWHPAKHIGGMCHYLLPNPRGRHRADEGLPGLYAGGAINLFLDAIRAHGTQPREYVVKMFGGGSMFPGHGADDCSGTCGSEKRAECRDVPCKNVLEGHDLLEKHGFTIAAEHVGGFGSRSLIFDLATGDVWLRQAAPFPKALRAAP